MNYLDIYYFLGKPESDWISIAKNEPNMGKISIK